MPRESQNLKIRIVDGSTLAAAFVSNFIQEKEILEVLLVSGGASKVGTGIARVLGERGVRVQVCLCPKLNQI